MSPKTWFCKKRGGFANETSKFEKELLQAKNKYITKMYNLLLNREVKEKEVKGSMICWAQDLGYNIYMNQWEQLWRIHIKFTVCINLRENVI